MDIPGTPEVPYSISQVKTGTTTASITVGWYALLDTGGVPLTGYKLYMTRVSTSTTTTAYDGTDQPAVLQTTITGLVLDEDYTFYVTGLNPSEGSASDTITLRAAGLPYAPGAITEVASSRTGSSIGLQWSAPTSDEGSAITAYTLVIVRDN